MKAKWVGGRYFEYEHTAKMAELWHEARKLIARVVDVPDCQDALGWNACSKQKYVELV